ncbi:hypothetical protein RI367_005394 [Sorochytrium milnesiophthora]
MGLKEYLARCARDNEPRIDLSGANLTKAPKELDSISSTTTKYLTLSKNKLRQVPDHVATLTHLESLNLYSNQLTTLPTRINELSKLTHLTVSNNKLEELPAGFGSCPSLVYLDLSVNKIRTLKAHFGYLTSLRALHLADNKLTELPAEVGNLVQLRTLVLRDNRLTELPRTLGKLVHLTVLHVEGNHDLRVLPKELGQCPVHLHDSRLRLLPNRGLHPQLVQAFKVGGAAAVWKVINADEYEETVVNKGGGASQGKKGWFS